MNITKSAPLPERPCEQLTCCEKNGSVQGNYINRVAKRHNCRITGKTKATRYGGPSTLIARYPQRKSADYYAVITSGWQCDQCAGLLVDCQPLGSMPSLRSLSRQAFLTHELKLPGPATSLICCNNVSSKRMFFFVLPERSNFGFSFFSCIGTYHHYKLKSNGTYHVKNTQPLNTAKPRSGGTLAGLLTTNDRKRIEVAMLNHTTHPQGRDSHNLNKYIWRFIALSTAQPRVIHIVATSEQEARQQSPAGCVMVFAARIRQEVHHVQ
ncbi:host cell division inhibitor Icd-like protein [Escherichia coli]|uniref:host cell division inhibitor Icd-like protein n=1 Tax=Escherichia coli TaxID=562 RepID=UPI003CCC3E5F